MITVCIQANVIKDRGSGTGQVLNTTLYVSNSPVMSQTGIQQAKCTGVSEKWAKGDVETVRIMMPANHHNCRLGQGGEKIMKELRGWNGARRGEGGGGALGLGR